MELAKAKIGRAAVVLLLAHFCLVLVLPVLDVSLHSHHFHHQTSSAGYLEMGGGLGQAGAFLAHPDHWDCPICFVIKLFGRNLLFALLALIPVIAFKPFVLNTAFISPCRFFPTEHHSRAPPFLAVA